MGAFKNYLVEHIDDFDDEDLLDMGYTKEDIEELRELCSED